MPAPVLLMNKEGAVATVTLNRPDDLNALSADLRLALGHAFRELQADPETRVVIITGAGRAFCAGMDLKELSSDGVGDSPTGFDNIVEAIAGFKGPVIAAVNGHAVTAGFELALACDFIIASSQAKFADTHARVGILPGWGLSQRLPRLIGIGRAKEISYTGNTITATQAYEWGLVNRVVAAEQLLPVCQALAAQMANCVPHILMGYKQLIDTGYGMHLPDALRYETAAAMESVKQVSAATIGTRVDGVFNRGREQAEQAGKGQKA